MSFGDCQKSSLSSLWFKIPFQRVVDTRLTSPIPNSGPRHSGPRQSPTTAVDSFYFTVSFGSELFVSLHVPWTIFPVDGVSCTTGQPTHPMSPP